MAKRKNDAPEAENELEEETLGEPVAATEEPSIAAGAAEPALAGPDAVDAAEVRAEDAGDRIPADNDAVEQEVSSVLNEAGNGDHDGNSADDLVAKDDRGHEQDAAPGDAPDAATENAGPAEQDDGVSQPAPAAQAGESASEADVPAHGADEPRDPAEAEGAVNEASTETTDAVAEGIDAEEQLVEAVQSGAGKVTEINGRPIIVMSAAGAAADAMRAALWELNRDPAETERLYGDLSRIAMAADFVLANPDAPPQAIAIHLALNKRGGSMTPNVLETRLWEIFAAVFKLVHGHLAEVEARVAEAAREKPPAPIWPGGRSFEPLPGAMQPSGFSPRQD